MFLPGRYQAAYPGKIFVIWWCSVLSVYLYSGTPGSGKSYEAVLNAWRNCKKRRFVIANFALKFTAKEIAQGIDQYFFYWPNESITIENLMRFAIERGMIAKMQENQCMVIIDEAGGRYNARDFKNSDRTQWIDFFSQHMKMGFDFILVAQMDRMIDRQIRGVIETEFKFRNINRFGPFALLPIKVFVKVETWYGLRQRVGAEFRIFRWKVANRYDRFKMFTGFQMSADLIALIEKIKRKEDPGQVVGHRIPITALIDDQIVVDQ